ncbi:MAG: hypothetical protein F6K32_28120 [Desertifilum sp. SIO1I2]|nr:hypothetical protein [Desertifilum sp. SIO1I2]
MGEEITPNHVVEVSGGIRSDDLAAIVQAICAGDLLTVLQSARTLIDSGKTPKLILSNLLAVYRDLLIFKSVPKSQSAIAGTLSYSQLRQVASRLDFISIDAALTQLQKSESQLRVTTSGATWLEVCLLNLIPKNERQPLREQQGSQHNGSKNSTAQELNSIWTKVIAATKPANRTLLSRAKLTSLNEDRCRLAVPTSDVKKFQSNIALIERIVNKALGYSVTVAIEAREELLT